MVVGRDNNNKNVFLTQAAVKPPMAHGELMVPFFLPAVGIFRACANHLKVSFLAAYACGSSGSKFLSYGVLKIKHV